VSTATPPSSVAVLDSALVWAAQRLEGALEVDPGRPTPCRDWDLGRLLRHLDDGLLTLGEAGALGHVSTDPLPRRESGTLVELALRHARAAQQAWHGRITSAPIGVGDLALAREDLVEVGALEVAVHAWDVSWATGEHAHLPDHLAVPLLDVADAVVTHDQRGRRFGAPQMVSPRAPAGTRLLAHLGRHG
jgi:uncharacterized protein (TIGR03086 family)